MMEKHDEAVAVIAARVEDLHHRKVPFRNYHGSTNSTRKSWRTRENIVDTSGLTHILEIKAAELTAWVEPNVPLDKLVEATLKYELVPPVIPEFPGITIGGGFCGTSGESSSIRHGVFENTILNIEMVLANGEIVRASRAPDGNADLFWGAASSCGTIGIITLLEIQLVKAPTYVQLTYHTLGSMDLAVKKIEEVTADDTVHYVDGIVFSKENIVICVGRPASKSEKHDTEIKIQSFTRSKDPWFYIHAEKIASASSDPVELIPIADYLFRYDRGGFWVAKYAYNYFFTPFNRITRRILDRFMYTRPMYHALHKSGLADSYILQDVGVPYESASEFADWLHSPENFGHYPLWLCPLRQPGKGTQDQSIFAGHAYSHESNYILNFGVWGPGAPARHDFVQQNRRIEEKVKSLKGLKCLYAHAYYTESEFWDIYDKKQYDALRERYHAEYLPSVYDKVKVDFEEDKKAPFGGIRPLAGLYGFWKVLSNNGGDYLLTNGNKTEHQGNRDGKTDVLEEGSKVD